MGKVRWTAEAARWLQDIHDYISDQDHGAATRVVRGIYERIQVLRRFPEIGHVYEAQPGQHIRILLHGHYRIAYLIKQDGDVDILGIFHGAMDIDRYL